MAEKEKRYKIFFVIDEVAHVAYVDKSAAKDLQPILRRFVYRDHPYAEQLLEGVAEPNLVLVEQQPLSPCKRVVADVYVREWSLLLESFGYRTYERTEEGLACFLLNDFQGKKIKMAVWAHSEEDALRGENVKRHECRKKEKTPRAPAQKYTKKPAQFGIMIRATQEVVRRFRAFCQELGVTQSDGLAMLLEKCDSPGNRCGELLARLEKADQQIVKLEKEIEELRRGEAINRKNRRVERFKVKAKVQKEFVKTYLACTPKPTLPKGRQLYRFRFDIFRENFEDLWFEYKYPTVSGTAVVFLDGFVYGRTDGVSFVFGEMQNGEKIKLRHIMLRNDFLGTYVRGNSYACEGAPWLVGYIIANDGATDLVAAAPLDLEWIQKKQKENVPSEDVVEEEHINLEGRIGGDNHAPKPSLDEKIKNATSRL